MKIVLSLLVLVISMNGLAKEGPQSCTYQFNTKKAKIEGTGFKYSEKEKAGVAGTFPDFKLSENSKKPSVNALLTGLVVTVDLVTLDSANSLRDKNMRETLFAGIVGDSVAKITVKKVTNNKIETEMELNEKTQNIVFDYKIANDTVSATGQFDVLDFALGDQLAALKKRCGSLHTGSDGKSVTWPTFDLKVTAPLKKECK